MLHRGNGPGNTWLVPSVPERPLNMLLCWFLARREEPLPWEVPYLCSALCSGLNLALKLDHPNPQKAQRQLGFLKPLGRVLRASREGQEG